MTACNICKCHKGAIIDTDIIPNNTNKHNNNEVNNYDTDSGMNETIESDEGDNTLIDCDVTFVDDDSISFIEDYERKLVARNIEQNGNPRTENGRSRDPRIENGRGGGNTGRSNIKYQGKEQKSKDKTPIDVDNMKDALLSSLYSQVEFLRSQLTFLNNQLDEKDDIIRNLLIKENAYRGRASSSRYLSTASSATLDDEVFGECSSMEESEESNTNDNKPPGVEGVKEKREEDRNELQKMFKELYLQFEQEKNGTENDVEINIVYSMKNDEKDDARGGGNDAARDNNKNNVDNDYDECEDGKDFSRSHHEDDLQNVVHGLHAQFERHKRTSRDAKYHTTQRNSCKSIIEAMKRDYENGLGIGKYTARSSREDFNHIERELNCRSYYDKNAVPSTTYARKHYPRTRFSGGPY